MRHRTRSYGFDEARMHRTVQAVIDCDGSRTKAARMLGVSVDVVRRQVQCATMRAIFVPDPVTNQPPRPETGYMPTHDVIAAECREIRKGWDRDTRRQRNVYGVREWSIPVPGDWRGAVEEACA
jgi:hypothetical protein